MYLNVPVLHVINLICLTGPYDLEQFTSPFEIHISTHRAIRVGGAGCCLFVNTGLDSGAPGGAQVSTHIHRSILYKNRND